MPTADQASAAQRCAEYLRDAFMAYNDEFRVITRRARGRFEQREWEAGRRDAVERIELYDRCVNRSLRAVAEMLGGRARDRALWQRIRREFTPLVADCQDVEFAKTYFSSVTRRMFRTAGVDPEIEFLAGEVVPLRNAAGPLAGRNYAHAGSLEDLFAGLLGDVSWGVPFQDLGRCAVYTAECVGEHYRAHEHGDTVLCVDVLEEVFYRDTRAYLVGKVTGWTCTTPLVIALANAETGIRVEAVVQTEDGVSAVFGFARSYFHVDFAAVSAAISFLKRILPAKPVGELFTILGRAKQGKTERYRHFTRHLEYSLDRFIFAPGKRGMVMLVFTLPSYEIVFKVIRDEFPPPKDTTASEVKARYEMVFKHDKAGRLVDAQEFRLLKLPRSRFSPDLLDELLTTAAGTTRVEGDDVVINHAYVQPRLRPLDLYVREASWDAAARAVRDYGQAIRDLARTNVFPGDLLLKNFGVSRHGRVIFYDYDELCLLTECCFRDIPTPRTLEDEMSVEPWFHVGKDDVFPEEFAAFLGLDAPLREVFTAVHGELLQASFWRDVQARIRAGEDLEVLPY